MIYCANSDRYSEMDYRACGRSGLKLPALSLGLWHNFGDTTPLEAPSLTLAGCCARTSPPTATSC